MYCPAKVEPRKRFQIAPPIGDQDIKYLRPWGTFLVQNTTLQYNLSIFPAVQLTHFSFGDCVFSVRS